MQFNTCQNPDVAISQKEEKNFKFIHMEAHETPDRQSNPKKKGTISSWFIASFGDFRAEVTKERGAGTKIDT